MPSPPEESPGDRPARAAEGTAPTVGDTPAQELEPASQGAPEPATDTLAGASGPSAEQQGALTPSTGALPPDPPDYKAVARISTQAVLEGIQLAFVHADLQRGLTVPGDWVANARTTSNASAEFDRAGLRLVVYCGFVTVWSPGLEKDAPAPAPKDAPLELHARFRLNYAINKLEGIEEGDEKYFAWTNGMLHAWPYWREIGQSMTLRMGLTPLVVGTFKIPWTGDPGRQKKTSEPVETAAKATTGSASHEGQNAEGDAATT
jgi:hypothetical protein